MEQLRRFTVVEMAYVGNGLATIMKTLKYPRVTVFRLYNK